MNTPAHIIIAVAALGKADKPTITWAAIIGALIPDLSLYLLSAWSMFVQGNTARHVFNNQYFSEEWQSIFAVDNSFIVWGIIIAVGLISNKDWLWVFGVAGFLHLCFDFPLHHDDARQHFWPVTDWVFVSPFSYWDHAHHGDLVGMLEIGLCLVLLVLLWCRFKSTIARILIILMALLQVAPDIFFRLLF